MSDTKGLAKVLAGTGPLLFDFDGPICSIFAGYPAPDVASKLRRVLSRLGVSVPDVVSVQRDPLEVLRWTSTLAKPSLMVAVEDALCTAERHAARHATPTVGGQEAILAARTAGKPVAVVSNNSADAITAYLEAHGLADHVALIVGRTYANPERMKPNPESILRTVSTLTATPVSCVLIGDSVSDVVAAHAAGVRCIGFANKPSKLSSLAEHGADVIITNMDEITSVLTQA